MSLESRIMADARRQGAICVRCFISDGTVCGRHYAGMRQHALGKGRGIKGSPFAVADLCMKCDAEMSEGTVQKEEYPGRIARSEEFLFLCMQSLMGRVKRGVLS